MPSATDIWQVVTPAAGTNYVTNPSFEIDTAGWTTGNTSVTRWPDDVARYGSWGLICSASNVSNYVLSDTLTTTTATATWTASVWVRAVDPVRFHLQNAVTTLDVASVDHPGGNIWRRLECTATVATGVQLRIYTHNLAASGWAAYYVDGFQLEQAAAATTYLDGDQEGCQWVGVPHASMSTRDHRETRGGTINTFEGIGLWVQEQTGIGVPPMEVSSQPLALSDGSAWTRTVAKDRVFTLVARIFGTGTPAGLHTARRTVTNAFASAFGFKRGPIVLRYVGGATGIAKQIEAHYESGLGWDGIDGADEVVALRFRAPDPCWYDEVETSSAVSTIDSLTASMVLRRNADGSWNNMDGGLVTPPGHVIDDMVIGLDGTVYVGGNSFTRADLGVGTRLLQWSPANDAWSRVGSNDPNDVITALAVQPGTGNLYASGNFTSIGGVAATRYAYWNRAASTWNAMTPNPPNSYATSLAFDAVGRLHASGTFTSAGGGATTNNAIWNGSSWAASGSIGAPANTVMAVGPDGYMYGVNGVHVYRYTTAWAPFTTSVTGTIVHLHWYGGSLYVTGSLSSVQGVAVGGIARWNGSQWSPVGSLAGGSVYGSIHLPDGAMVAYGAFTVADGISTPSGLARWDGTRWLPMVNQLPYAGGIAQVFQMVAGRDGAITMGGSFGGTVQVPGVTTLTNSGSAVAYPVFELTGVSNLYSIENLTTGQVIKFNAPYIYVSETLTIDLRPGKKTIRSVSRDFLPDVLTTSDLATFGLAPGTNRIGVLCNATGTGLLRFRQRHWAAD